MRGAERQKTRMKLIIDQTAVDEVLRIRAEKDDEQVHLRVTVEGGGCSGFQYKYDWDSAAPADDDIIFDQVIITDPLSLKYMDGSVIKFNDNMMGRMFQIENPKANSSCGCGTSFSL